MAILGKRAEVHRILGEFRAFRPRPRGGLGDRAPEFGRAQGTDGAATAVGGPVIRLRRWKRPSPRRPAGSDDITTLHYGLAKSYEDLGEHAASWRHLSAANRLQRARFQYDPAHERAVIDRIIAGFRGVQPMAPDSTGEQPIFIVGTSSYRHHVGRADFGQPLAGPFGGGTAGAFGSDRRGGSAHFTVANGRLAGICLCARRSRRRIDRARIPGAISIAARR